jgi:hypothetical protein
MGYNIKLKDQRLEVIKQIQELLWKKLPK